MAVRVHIRRIGAADYGWTQVVEVVPTVGTLLTFGCGHGEETWTPEGNALTAEGPWRVVCLRQHFLCETEAEDDPQTGVMIEVIVTPADDHERALVRGYTYQPPPREETPQTSRAQRVLL
jgi:hypothetical protein